MEEEGKKIPKTGEVQKSRRNQKGWMMASKFGISVDKISDGVGLKLAGDFDTTSAYELIYAIKKLPEDVIRVAIFTDGLKDILPFGLACFSPVHADAQRAIDPDCVHGR